MDCFKMRKGTFLVSAFFLMAMPSSISSQSRKSGYYKDLFMDSGIMLTSRDDLPVARFLNLSMERICTMEARERKNVTEYDSILQRQKFVGYELDENGVLLYPDGAPRFRMIYVNGGRSTSHGKSLSPEGIENVRRFYAHGGSYVGTCAGAYFSCRGFTTKGVGNDNPAYSGIWHGYTTPTGLNDSYTSLLVEKNSPLLKYYDFGGDMKIDSVRHNGGCYMPEREDVPKGTEILLRFDGDTLKLTNSIHKTVNAWAYKESSTTGRVVVTGSHPEAVESDERLEMFASMVRYALDGNGEPQLKGELQDTIARKMTMCTHDNDPAFTRIGDKQYHHFVIQVPKKTDSVEIQLSSCKGWTGFDLYLYASENEFAFNDNSKYHHIAKGVDKTLVIPHPKAGKLYVSVYCDTTVETLNTQYGEQYTGHLEVLNGVPYIIKATINK